MEIREYAERVLWGESLTLKLDVPDLLTDSTPGLPIGRVDAPKRPAELKLSNPQESSGGFPKHNELENEEARGRVLHFLPIMNSWRLSLWRSPFSAFPMHVPTGASDWFEPCEMNLNIYVYTKIGCRRLGWRWGALASIVFFGIN